jgi:hypothetical protein
MDAYLLFATIYITAAATPGIDTMSLLGRTLEAGWRAAVPYSIGITLAKMIMVAVSYFGLSALLAASPEVFLRSRSSAQQFFSGEPTKLGQQGQPSWQRRKTASGLVYQRRS